MNSRGASPGAARERDRKTQTGGRNVNHQRAILADFEDRGRAREPRHVGSVDTGVAGVRVFEVTSYPGLGPVRFMPPRLQSHRIKHLLF